jgi:hypothetical protein
VGNGSGAGRGVGTGSGDGRGFWTGGSGVTGMVTQPGIREAVQEPDGDVVHSVWYPVGVQTRVIW